MPRRVVRRTRSSITPETQAQIPIKVKINGVEYSHTVEPRLLLVHYIRDLVGLTGTHVGCDTSHCGACTVLVKGLWGDDWLAVKSCTVLAAQIDGKEVLTIEGLAKNGELHPLQRAFWENHGLQCGFCTPGMIMAALGLLLRNPNPTREEIKWGISGNLCRCTGYVNIIKSIEAAAKEMREKGVTV
ncbi:MAG: (2Fe-2S)-binding protein [Nitrososphaerota archaeon]